MSSLYSRLRTGAALLLVGAALPAQAATIIVSSNADDTATNGNCTLREAVLAANTNAAVDQCAAGDAGGDTILLTAITGQTIKLTLGQIEITDGVTIGNAVATATIDASTGARIFRIQVAGPAEPVQITSVTLRNGAGLTGGAVLVEDGQTMTFTGVTFVSNTSAASGGAVRFGTGTHTLDACTFVNNSTTASTVTDGGGAVYNNGGSLTVTGSTFLRNTASAGTANGGAILNGSGSTLAISGASDFRQNAAARAGGAIETAGTLTIADGMFQRNTAGINGGALHITGAVAATITGAAEFILNAAAGEGGALWNSVSGTLNVTGAQLTLNTAGGAEADQGGGGLYSDGGTTTLTDVTISRNSATGALGSGGGILTKGPLTMTRGVLSQNTSVRAGGGLENNASAGVALTGVVIRDNVAGSAPGFGGGVHITGAGTVSVSGGTIAGNSAVEGGGLWKAAPGTLTIDGTTIQSNTATGAAADQGGGGVYSDGGAGLTITNAFIHQNQATGAAGSGGAVFNNGGSVSISESRLAGNSSNRAGGAIEDNAGTGFTLTNVTLNGNNAGTAPGNGGALHISGGGMVTVTGGVVSGNTAVEGGGLWKSGPGTLTVVGTTIDGNTASGAAADQGGGGVYNDGAGGMLTLTDATIQRNSATGASGSGGGLLNNTGGMSVVTGVTFSRNTASRAGGAVEDNAGTRITMLRVTMDRNQTGSAPGNGGGLHITGSGVVTVDSSFVQRNTAANQGGGLWNSGIGSLTVTATTVSLNSAAVGGGLYQQAGPKGITFVLASLVQNNRATAAGGGLAADGAAVLFQNSTLSGNRADNGGGAATNGGQLLFSGATVTLNFATTAGGGLFNGSMDAENLSPDNTIVAGNRGPAGRDLAGPVMSRGYNLFGRTNGATVMMDEGAGPDITRVDAGLQPLADNGGATQTHALTAGSPAIGAGMTSLVVDQRGYTRLSPSSIGAFEFGGVAPSGLVATAKTDDATAATAEARTFALSSAAPNPFRSRTTLRATTATDEPVEVVLYDALGRRVQSLYSGTPTGPVEVTVDGSLLAPGVYVVRMTSATAQATQRITVTR